MNKRITCKELYLWMSEEKDFTIIDVLPAEFYESRHIPQAVNACVYGMDFIEQVRKITSDKKRCIVVYDSSDRSQASGYAASKMADDGFTQVFQLAGGIDEWEGSGYPVDVLGPDMDEEPAIADGVHAVDCQNSRLEWTGRNIFKRHRGAIDISGGEIVVKNGVITSGYLTIDMRSIKDDDLTDPAENSLLISHLMSEDFFHVDRFPDARFELTEGQILADAFPGSPNCLIKGSLTIKGVTNEVVLPAMVVPDNGQGIRAQACFDIDRTEWNIAYGSGKLFEKLGRHLVNDTVSLELHITAR